MTDALSTGETPSAGEQAADETKELPELPEPTAIGNDKVAILRHCVAQEDLARGADYPTARIELAIRNISDTTIATAVFEAVVYDAEGNVLDTVKHKEIELAPETSRLIFISTSVPVYDSDDIATYAVRLVKATTTAMEKVQLRKYELRTIASGEEEVQGVAKNLSDVKTDAAVVATFYDADRESIGTRVLVLKDMEPRTARRFALRFKPEDPDTVRSCSISIGEVTA